MIECVALIPSAASQGGSECSDPRARYPKRIEIFCDQCRRRGVGSLIHAVQFNLLCAAKKLIDRKQQI